MLVRYTSKCYIASYGGIDEKPYLAGQRFIPTRDVSTLPKALFASTQSSHNRHEMVVTVLGRNARWWLVAGK